MNRLIKTQLELETRRKALGTLLDVPVEDRAEDFGAKLEAAKAAITTAQADLQTVAQAEPEPPEHRQDNPGGAELRAMMDGANVGELFDNILSHGQSTGQMAELQQHLGLQGNQVPLSLLSGYQGAEERAVTPGATNVGQTQQPIVPYVFPMSSAAFLGVDMPTVGVGEPVFPVLTSELTVGTPAENAAQAEYKLHFSIPLRIGQDLPGWMRHYGRTSRRDLRTASTKLSWPEPRVYSPAPTYPTTTKPPTTLLTAT